MGTVLIIGAIVILLIVLLLIAGRLELWTGRWGANLMRRSRGDVRFGYEEDKPPPEPRD